MTNRTLLVLEDGSVAGLRRRYLPIASLQHHFQGSSGLQDNVYLFDRFLETARQGG